MSNEKRETINELVLQGGIVHKLSTSDVTILTITTGNITSIKNYPKVVCFREAKEQADKFKEGDYVRVTANIQSSKRNPKIKNQALESIFAESVEEAKSVMEEKFNVEGYFVAYQNELKICGPVVSTSSLAGNVCNIVVRTMKNDRLSFVKLTKFIKSPNDPALAIAPGDYVYALGHIQTRKKEVNGKPHTFQNCVISEIKKG